MTTLETVVQVARSVQAQWEALAEKHKVKAEDRTLPALTRDHHQCEHRYYQGKAHGVRQVVEMLEDAGVGRGEPCQTL